MIYLLHRIGKKYYHQEFLEECEYDAKEKKMLVYIIDDSDIEDSDYANEENFKEESDFEHYIKYY